MPDLNAPHNVRKADEHLIRQTGNTVTRHRGDNESEYQIYVAAAESLGWNVKSYEEWLGP